MPTQHRLIDALGTQHLDDRLKSRSLRGGVLSLGSQATQFVIQSVATVVLARLLPPADFGLVAMATAVTGLGQTFADLGLTEATIQRRDISHSEVNALFWVNVTMGLGLMLVTISLAPVLAWFYREPRLRDITFLLSLTFLICGLRGQHDALLKRQMRYFSLAIRDVVSSAVAVPLAIIMAWHGAGYWSLVALPLALNATQMVLSWLLIEWRPGLATRGAQVGSMIAFGGNLAASYAISNLNRTAESVLIGWRWGAGPLGLYSRAYNLLMLPIRQLSRPASSVVVPTFSRLQDDPERLARYYLRAVNLIMWIAAPVFGFLFVAAKPVILIALGNQWLGAAPVFRMLAISALGQMLLESAFWLLVSRGESGRLLKLVLTICPIMILGALVGLPFGIKGVAFIGSLVLVAMFPLLLKFTFRGTRLTLPRLGQAIFVPISLSLAAVGFSEVLLGVAAPSGIAAQLLFPALAFAATYALSLARASVRREILSLKGLFPSG